MSQMPLKSHKKKKLHTHTYIYIYILWAALGTIQGVQMNPRAGPKYIYIYIYIYI